MKADADKDYPITLAELAAQLSLSKATVSLALRDTGRLSESTRERVKAAAEAMGYRPDPVMSAFSRHRRKHAPRGAVIAELIHHRKRDAKPKFLSELCQRAGYRLDTFELEKYQTQETLAHILDSRGTAGVIVPEQSPSVWLEPGVWDRFRGVYCGPYPGNEPMECPFDTVRHNPFDAVTLGWQKAVASGYRRIGFCLPTQRREPTSVEAKTLASYRYQQSRAGRRIARLKPFVCPFDSFRAGNGPMKQWLEDSQPDVIIGGTIAVRTWIQENQWRIPEDVALISVRARQSAAEVAGCLIDTQTILAAGIRHLNALIQHPNDRWHHLSASIVINPIWQPGRSFPERGD